MYFIFSARANSSDIITYNNLSLASGKDCEILLNGNVALRFSSTGENCSKPSLICKKLKPMVLKENFILFV